MAPVVEVWGDVFAMPTALAHTCMGAGISVGLKEYFGRVDELLQQGKKVGEVAYLKHNTDYIFYLITKKRFSGKKICLDNVSSCLVNLSALCSSLGIKQESMPRLGCGLDLLKYEDVLPLIHAAFYDCSVKVNIVTPPPTFNGMSVLGDSQGLRLLLNLNRGKLTASRQNHFQGLLVSVSGLTVLTELLKTVDVVPNNSLGDALLFSGTNDLLALAAMESGHRAALMKTRHVLSILRIVLSKKCKSYARAIITTVPPLFD